MNQKIYLSDEQTRELIQRCTHSIDEYKKIGNAYYTKDRILSDTEGYKNRAERRKEAKNRR